MTDKDFLIGYITQRQKKKVHDKNSHFYQQVYYKLWVSPNNYYDYQANSPKLFVYPNVVSPTLFALIAQKLYLTKRYHFTVQKSKWGWVLLEGKELDI